MVKSQKNSVGYMLRFNKQICFSVKNLKESREKGVGMDDLNFLIV